jgi:hypothetical protein
MATLWKNGVAEHLTDGSESAWALGLAVHGGDVYVVGYESNGSRDVAKLWKNGVAQELTDGKNDALATAVSVSESGDVYVVGK